MALTPEEADSCILDDVEARLIVAIQSPRTPSAGSYAENMLNYIRRERAKAREAWGDGK